MARKILIADDSLTVQKKASGILTGEGMEVVTVSNGVAAIKKLPTVLPMVILADISMPGKDGYEVCEFVKGSKEYADVPVILVVGDDDMLDEQKRARVRADARIRKPFDRDELISTVNKYLAIAEAAAAKPVPPPVVKAPPAPAYVEPMDEEPVIETKEAPPDFSQFGGGIAFADAFEDAAAAPSEPEAAANVGVELEPTPLVEAAPAATEEPIIEVEAPASELIIETGASQSAVPEAVIESAPMPEPELPAAAEPVLIEEQAAPEHHEEHEHPHPHAAEQTVIFRAPADIAQPLLSDELEPAPAAVEAAAPAEPAAEEAPAAARPESISNADTGEYEAVTEPAPVSAATLESFSLSEAAAGNVRLATVPPEPDPAPAPEPEPAPMESEPAAAEPVTEAAPAAVAEESPTPVAAAPKALGAEEVYKIVYLVVAKMSPRLPAQAIEEIAKPLAKEITAELGSSSQ